MVDQYFEDLTCEGLGGAVGEGWQGELVHLCVDRCVQNLWQRIVFFVYSNEPDFFQGSGCVVVEDLIRRGEQRVILKAFGLNCLPGAWSYSKG